jgi:predicted dehydrogenase
VVTAACDVWKARRDSVVAQFKDTCKPYADFRECSRAGPGRVIIATPPHWHALQAVAACEAGKDIYLQKPMTLHLGESLAVRNAVKRAQPHQQIGTQIHAGDNYRRVVEFIRAGNLGPIGTARTFNVMNQAPDGVGTPTTRNGPRWSGLGDVVRTGAEMPFQSHPGGRLLFPLFVDGLQRWVDARDGAAHHRPAGLGAGSRLPLAPVRRADGSS